MSDDKPFDYGATKSDGQHERYPAKVGPVYVQPIRNQYRHRRCGVVTRCGEQIARTYATTPGFYGATYCGGCQAHYNLEEFTWLPDGLPMTETGGPPGVDWRDRDTIPPPPRPAWALEVEHVNTIVAEGYAAIRRLYDIAHDGQERERLTEARDALATAVLVMTTRIQDEGERAPKEA